jgi:hypothetical protein
MEHLLRRLKALTPRPSTVGMVSGLLSVSVLPSLGLGSEASTPVQCGDTLGLCPECIGTAMANEGFHFEGLLHGRRDFQRRKLCSSKTTW